MFVSYGPIAKPSPSQKEGWYYVKADDNIGAYYNWFAKRGLQQGWNPCMNGCHVTFIAGEKDDRIVSLAEIDKYIGREVSFSYVNQVFSNGQAFWVSALCPELDLIRMELGLKPRMLYHITLGNIKHLKG